MKYDSLDPEALANHLECESLLVLERVSSTQDLLHELATEGAPSGSIVLTDEQVRGRGRQSRHWLADPGTSVLFSYLLRPSSAPAAAVTSLRVGLSVLDTFDDLGVEAMLKWPNDVIVGNRKAAGILCEARWRRDQLMWIVVGIGINVYGPVPDAVTQGAIALDQVVTGVSRLAVLERLIPRLRTMHESELLSEKELERLRRHDWLADRQIAGPVNGRACGVAQNGALQVATVDGTVTVVGGEVVVA